MNDINENKQLDSHFLTDIRMIGDKTTNSQIIMLLAFIRDIIQSGKPKDIKLSVGKHLKSNYFDIQANEQTVPQIVAEDYFEIN